MANIVEITDFSDPLLDVYARLTEAQLLNRFEPAKGMFIAESPKVIHRALDAGCEPVSLLMERKDIDGSAREVIARCPDIPVFTADEEVLCNLTGYHLTRGVLCAMRRPTPPSIEDVCKEAERIVVIDGVVDSTNIGAIFRSAAALGMDAVLVTENSCDPYNRRAVRVSMGSVFLIPWTWLDSISSLSAHGYKTIAMALADNSISLDSPQLTDERRLAVIMGTEGDGLPLSHISQADYVVKIPMAHGVDSLNVAAASAVAFCQLGKRNHSK